MPLFPAIPEIHILPVLLAAARADRSPWRTILFVAGFILIPLSFLAAYGLYHALKERRRTQSLQQTAESLGFEFFPTGDATYLAALGTTPVFRIGTQHNLWNLMRGTSRNFEVAVFDYSYVTGSGRSARTVQQTILCLQSPALRLPDFTLAPKSFWDAVGALFGHQNIEVEAHPLFSHAYVLRSSDPDATRAAFTDNVLQFFDEKPGFNSQGANERLLLYRAAKRTPPDQIAGFVEDGLKLLAQFQ